MAVESMYELIRDFEVELEQNISDEAAARAGYYSLLKYSNLMTAEEERQIKNIIEEELKHTEILQQMVFKRTQLRAEH